MLTVTISLKGPIMCRCERTLSLVLYVGLSIIQRYQSSSLGGYDDAIIPYQLGDESFSYLYNTRVSSLIKKYLFNNKIHYVAQPTSAMQYIFRGYHVRTWYSSSSTSQLNLGWLKASNLLVKLQLAYLFLPFFSNKLMIFFNN